MKKIILLSALLLASIASEAQNNWSIGAFTSGNGTMPHFAGGMSQANGRFNANPFGAATLGIVGRYFISNHWSIQSGMNVSQLGFDYSISNDYSLMKKHNEHATKNSLGIGIIQVPLTAIYAFKPNCSNFRLFVGAGVSIMNSFETTSKTLNVNAKGDEGIKQNEYLNQTMTSNQFMVPTAQFMWGVEKLLKKGRILQAGFIANFGFINIASSDVSYSIENKTYNHTFATKGNYAGMMLNYYFKPMGKK